MSRQYPKYLYQKVTNAKSNGEFICSLISPRILVKVIHSGHNMELQVVEQFEDVSDAALQDTCKQMHRWYLHSIQPHIKAEKGMTVYEAYTSLLETKAVNKILDLAKSTVSTIKKNILDNQLFPKCETMRDHLTKSGWSMVSEELWENS